MSDSRDKERPSDRALQEFLSEAQEIVESFNRDLLAVEAQFNALQSAGSDAEVTHPGGASVDPERLNNIYRAIHSLKGLSGLFNLGAMTQLTHHLEDLLDSLRLGKVQLSLELLDMLFEAVELLTRLVQAASTGTLPAGHELTDFILALDRVAIRGPQREVDALESSGLDAGILSVLTEYEEHRLRENLRSGQALHWIRSDFDKLTIDLALDEIRNRIKQFGEIITCVPTDSEDDSRMALEFLLGTRVRLAELEAELVPAGLRVIPVIPLWPKPRGRENTLPPSPGAGSAGSGSGSFPASSGSTLPTPPSGPRRGPPSSSFTAEVTPARPPSRPAAGAGALDGDDRPTSLRSASQTVRVDIRKLDYLMNLVGELGIVRASIQRSIDYLRRQGAAAATPTEIVSSLHREGRGLERKLNELQSGILEVRMVPLGQLFDKLARVVRKISRDVGKEIRFVVEGGDTELDKLIVEELSDPLMHIIRNGIDHGIESPQQRLDLGKPAQGTLRLLAHQKGNHVTLEIGDDGAGLDEERIRRLAVERQILDAEQARSLGRREVYNLIFLPGFSTKGAVSELSGRGVGMDVVKTNISKLSGIIDIRSDHGVGTTLTITLPITLAIIPALVIGTGGQTYAMPLNSVLESVSVTPEEIKTLSRHEVITVRGATLPLLRLTDVFGLGRTPDNKRMFVVVVGVAQHRMGLVVDTLVGQQDIVIKSLGRSLARVRGIAGATELGGQQTVLVLDVAALVEDALGVRVAGGRVSSSDPQNTLLGLTRGDAELAFATEEHYYRGLQERVQERPQVELLTFMLGDEEYALGIRRVREIIRVPRLTAVPRVAPFLLGVISVRGGIVPVVDLRRRLHLDVVPHGASARILITLRDGDAYGLLVDRVRQVVRMATADIEPPPMGLSGAELEFVQGIGRYRDRLLVLLDLDPVLSFRAEEVGAR